MGNNLNANLGSFLTINALVPNKLSNLTALSSVDILTEQNHLLINKFTLELPGKDKRWINLNEPSILETKSIGKRHKLGKDLDLYGPGTFPALISLQKILKNLKLIISQTLIWNKKVATIGLV